jgi:hypothetical protein
MTLLGTITTTITGSKTLSGLSLSGYKQLYFVIDGVSSFSTSGTFRIVDPDTTNLSLQNVSSTASNRICGNMWIDLVTGTLVYVGGNTSSSTPSVSGGDTTIGATTFSTSATSVTFNLSTSVFDAGSILVYGVK